MSSIQYDGIPAPTGERIGVENTVLYDRVEVVRGATGLLTGAGAPSASINLVRKRASSDVFTGNASALAGSWNHLRAAADLSAPLAKNGKVRGRIAASVRNTGLYVDLYKDKTQAVLATIDIDVGENTTFILAADYQHQKVRGAPWGSYPLAFRDGTLTDWKPSKLMAAKWSTTETTRYSFSAGVEHSFGPGWKLKANYSHYNREGNDRFLYLGGIPDKVTGEGLGVSRTRYRRPSRQNSVDLHVDGTFKAIGREHGLVLGLMHSRLHDVGYNAAPTTPNPPAGSFFDWDGSYPEPDWNPLAQYFDDRTRQYAAYGALKLSPADPVKIIAGARYSKWKADNSGTIRSHEKFTPYVGAIIDVTKQFSVYASYTSIFNPQNYRDRNGQYLDPIIGNNYEAGIKAEFLDGRLNASIAVFQTEQDNVAEQDGTHFVPGTTNPAYVGVKGVKTKGFEAEVSGELADGWQLSAGFSRAAPKQSDGTIFASNVPRNKFNLFTSYRLGGRLDGLTLGAGGRWVSGAYRNINTPAGAVRYTEGDYAIVDLMVRYEIRKGVSAQINADNLFNRVYYQHLGYYGGSFGLTRNVTARLAVEF